MHPIKKRVQKKDNSSHKNLQMKKTKSIQRQIPDPYQISQFSQHLDAIEEHSSLNFQENQKFPFDFSLTSNQAQHCSSQEFPYFGRKDSAELKSDEDLKKDKTNLIHSLQISKSLRKSERKDKVEIQGKKKRIKQRITFLKSQMELLKNDFRGVKEIISSEKITFNNIFQLSKIAKGTFIEYLEKQSQQKLKLSLEIKYKNKTIQDLVHTNKVLTETINKMEKNINFQNNFLFQKKKNEENSLQSLSNQLYQVSTKNELLLKQNDELKTQNYELNERVFDFQQKLKTVDLEIQKKFHTLLGEYHDNFLDKAMEVRAKIGLLHSELQNDYKGRQNKRNNLSKISTNSNVRESFEKKKSFNNLKKSNKKDQNMFNINRAKSDNEQSLEKLQIESKILDDSRRLQKQKSLIHFLGVSPSQKSLSKTKGSLIGRSLRNLKQDTYLTLENSIQMNYSINQVDNKFDKLREKFSEDVKLMKKRKHF